MSSGRVDERGAPPVRPHVDSPDEWCVLAVNLVQAIIGCAYGMVRVEAVEAMAAAVRPPRTPRESALIRGVVFDCLARKLGSISPAECARLTRIVQEIARMREANLRRTVADIRALAGIRGPDLAERIRGAIDAQFARKLKLRAMVRTFAVSVEEARAAFQQQFGESIDDYLMRRRVEEGIRMVRAGISVEAAALNAGWRGKRHFYQAVRKLLGTTPARLRDQAPGVRKKF